MAKPTYRSSLEAVDGGFEQSYTANVIHIDDELLAFGELVPDPQRGLPYGTPVHSLMVHLERKRPVTFELNDQANAVGASDVATIEVARTWMRIRFQSGRGPLPGRVSLAPEIELFRDAKRSAKESAPLASLQIAYAIAPKAFARLGKLLASAAPKKRAAPKKKAVPKKKGAPKKKATR